MLELSTKDSKTLSHDGLKSLIKAMDNREILLQDVINESLITALTNIINGDYTINETIAGLYVQRQYVQTELANRQLNSLIKQQKSH